MKLNIEIKEEKDVLIADLSGDLDINTNENFKANILENISKNKSIIFNCENLEYIDSVGLGAFISVHKKLKEIGQNFVLKGLKPHLKKIFVITDLDKVFKIEE